MNVASRSPDKSVLAERPLQSAKPPFLGFGLGLGRRREEAAVLAPRQADAADGAAVDAGRRDADEEPAVEARVTGLQCGVGGFGGQGFGPHEASLGGAPAREWQF